MLKGKLMKKLSICGSRLRRVRELAGLNASQVAVRLGLNKTSIYGLEKRPSVYFHTASKVFAAILELYWESEEWKGLNR